MPIRFSNFAGNDGLNKDGRRAYSSYVEASAPWRLAGLDWEAAIGAVPYATSFYSKADGFAVVNVSAQATYDIKVNDRWSLPIFCKVIANPSSQCSAFVVGVSLRP